MFGSLGAYEMLSSSNSIPENSLLSQNQITDNLLLTISMMILCGLLLNIFSFFFLVPAMFYSKKVIL